MCVLVYACIVQTYFFNRDVGIDMDTEIDMDIDIILYVHILQCMYISHIYIHTL